MSWRDYPPDIEAEIRLKTTEEGGRTSSVYTEYRPQFVYNDTHWVAIHVYPDVDEVRPGDTVRAYLYFLSPDQHLGVVHEQMNFDIMEGARVGGEGTITRILNLSANAERVSRERDS